MARINSLFFGLLFLSVASAQSSGQTATGSSVPDFTGPTDNFNFTSSPSQGRTITVVTATTAFPVQVTSPPDPNNREIRLCLMLENSPSLFYDYRRVAAAIDMGIEKANSEVLMGGYRLNLFYKNLGPNCTKKNDVVKYALQVYTGGMTCHAYLGPGCGYAADSLYNLAEYMQTPIMACPAAGSCTATGREQYPLMTRTSFTHKDTVNLLFRFFTTNSYKHAVVIMDDSNSFYEQLSVTFTSELRKRPDFSQSITSLPLKSKDATNQTYVNLLTNGNSSARVFVLCSNATVVRQFLIAALALGMTDGSYVYIGIELFQSSTWGTFTWSMGNAQDRDAKLAFNSLLLVTLNPKRSDYYDAFSAEIKRLSRLNYNYSFGAFEEIDPVVISFYESIIMYSTVLNTLISSNGRIYSGQSVSAGFRGQTFQSPVSGPVQVDTLGDRRSDFVIRTFDSDSGRFQDFYTYNAISDSFLQVGPPSWPSANGLLPPDTPRCGFTGDNPICHPQRVPFLVSCKPKTSDFHVGSLGHTYSNPSLGAVCRIGPVSAADKLKLYHVGANVLKLFLADEGSLELEIVFDIKNICALLSGAMLGVAVAIPVIVFLALCGLVGYLIVRSLRNEGLDPNWWRVQQAELDITGNRTGSQGSRVASSKKSLTDDATSQTTRQTDATSNMSAMAGRTATLRGNVISVADVQEKRRRPNPQLIKEMNQVRVISHQNLQRLLGVSVDDDGYIVFVLGELCQKGSLMDLLEKDSLKLDWSFKNSLIKDIVMGMAYLHGSSIESHGNLTAHTCLVDSRFMLKITDFGLTNFREAKDLAPPTEEQDDRNFDFILWRAPELMRQVMPVKGSQKGDVYSFGILLQQIILRSAPFDTPGDATKAHQTAKEMVLEVKKGNQPPFRPVVPASACSSELYNLMERCWDEYPIERPTFSKIKEGLKKVIGNSGDNIIDHLLKRMEQYASDLEAQVAEKTEQFMEEKRRSEELLGQLLPKSVAESLTRGQNVDPESYDSVTIYFSDIVGFTTISAAGTPMDVVSMLNNLYTMFDSILERFDAYKVETIGDAYMVASGLPVRNGNRHASEIALVSLQIRKDLDTFKIPHQPEDKLRLRIGVHSGNCVAGIVGLKMPRYCLFGDTVQIAMKMESSGEPMKIQVSFAAKQLLDDIGGFQMQERDHTVEFKDGEIRTFWLLSGK